MATVATNDTSAGWLGQSVCRGSSSWIHRIGMYMTAFLFLPLRQKPVGPVEGGKAGRTATAVGPHSCDPWALPGHMRDVAVVIVDTQRVVVRGEPPRRDKPSRRDKKAYQYVLAISPDGIIHGRFELSCVELN